MKNIYETYKEMRDRYYRCLKDMETDSTEKLKRACEYTDRFLWKLYGMLDLMLEAEAVPAAVIQEEQDRAVKLFDSITLFHAYIDECGELMVFGEH